ncbi:MAG: class I SAM-dependent methyltransferase [Bacteroidota bacterium]
MPPILSPQKDPFGQAALDYYHGAQKAEIRVISDVAVDDVIPAAYLFRTYQQMPEWEQAAMDACGKKVLDIGAGVGSHSLFLQNLGHEVVALDTSPGLISVMEARELAHPVHMDLWEYPPASFDTLLLMMNGIGIVGDLKGLNRFLQKAPDWLAPGGQILLDSSDIRYLYEEGDLTYPVSSKRYYGIIRYQMIYKDSQSDPFDWLYIDFERLSRHAEMFGFEATKIVDGGHFEYLASLKHKDF